MRRARACRSSRKHRYERRTAYKGKRPPRRRCSEANPGMTAYIDSKVSSGAYATGSEVVRAGLRALQERDAASGRWLPDEVAPTYDAIKSGTEKLPPAKAVFAEARAPLRQS